MPSLDYQIDPSAKRKTPLDICACGRPKMARAARCWQCQTAWPDRFWTRVEKTETCWLWVGQIAHGYGIIELDGVSKRAHRVSWEMANGPIPGSLTIDHLCLVTSCVNPEHMELVTGSENVRRAHARRRAARTHCRNGHPTDDRPRCRQCGRDASRRWAQAHR